MCAVGLRPGVDDSVFAAAVDCVFHPGDGHEHLVVRAVVRQRHAVRDLPNLAGKVTRCRDQLLLVGREVDRGHAFWMASEFSEVFKFWSECDHYRAELLIW